MKKVIAAALALLLMTAAGCGAQTPESTESAAATVAPTATAEIADIGFCLAGDDAFRTQLKADIESECAALGYRVKILSAETAEAQQKDIQTLLGMNVSVMVIDPVDIDALETMLGECETQDVRVIGVVNMINGAIDMLISPFYKEAGEKAADYANDLLGTGGCLELKSACDDSVMQLLSDGFEGALVSGITVLDAYCGEDEQAALDAAKEALQADDAGLIFAQNGALGKGALQAIQQTGSNAHLIVFDGSMETITSVSAGDVDAAIFFGPGQLARYVVYHADQMIKNASYEAPQFVELTLEAVDADNVSQYLSDSAAYAEVKGD